MVDIVTVYLWGCIQRCQMFISRENTGLQKLTKEGMVSCE